MNIPASFYKMTNNKIALSAGKKAGPRDTPLKSGKTRFSPLIILIFCVGMLSACVKSSTAKDSYLDPIPQSTLDAYRPVWPIQSELQAVIAARREVSTESIVPAKEPRVLLAEKLTLSEAQQRLDTSGDSFVEDHPGTTSVWLVFFDGYWQVLSPDSGSVSTVAPPAYGCFSIVLTADEESSPWVQEIACPPCETSICLTPYPTLVP